MKYYKSLIGLSLLIILATFAAIAYSQNQDKSSIDNLYEYFGIDRDKKSKGNSAADSIDKNLINSLYNNKPHTEISIPLNDKEDERFNLLVFGSVQLNMNYGKSWFTNDKYQRFDTEKPTSQLITPGFNSDNLIKIHMEGAVSDRVTVLIDHDSERENNQYYVQYKALKEDELVQKVEAGYLNLKISDSKFATYDGSSISALGIDSTIKKGKFKLRTFGSITRGVAETENFSGGISNKKIKLHDYQYQAGTWYQLEPFIRFDNLSTAPANNPAIYNYITMNSAPTDPEKYRPFNVSIDSTGFEMYMDDLNQQNNKNSIQLSVDNGKYNKLINGSDYIINYNTGEIQFVRAIPQESRIFVSYTRNNGGTDTADPSARLDVFPGKIFTFIKYGKIINEDYNFNGIRDADELDVNKDGKLNYDIYELRSFYYIGEKNLSEKNISVRFYSNNNILSDINIKNLGLFSINTSQGLIHFNLREPFKKILSSEKSKYIYTENISSNTFEKSVYSISIDYSTKGNIYKLKHSNIIPESVQVKLNQQIVSTTLYNVDTVTGIISFKNPNYPLIDSGSDMEIHYEYLPFINSSSTILVGIRSDYQLFPVLNIGSTLLYNGNSAGNIIPAVGEEPSRTGIIEGDIKLDIKEDDSIRIANKFLKKPVEKLPIEFIGYAEYAHSFRQINSFGKALVDDMSAGATRSISLSEKDWVYASHGSEYTDLERGKLFYKYYRSLTNSQVIYGEEKSGIDVDYSIKPGPYNIAESHITSDSDDWASSPWQSLALNFSFSSGEKYVAVETRNLLEGDNNFSDLQYIEVWYRGATGSGNVNLKFQLGVLNEDSDNDGVLDTEDKNQNLILDYSSLDKTEDIGYIFTKNGINETVIGAGPKINSYTNGDGVLNSEDFNSNGYLDTNEEYAEIPGADSDKSNFSISLDDHNWKVARFYLKRDSLTSAQLNALSHSNSLRLILEKNNTQTGTIYIDSLQLVKAKWHNFTINNLSEYNPDKFKVTFVNTLNDILYSANSFQIKKNEEYQDLFGKSSTNLNQEDKDKSLQIDYQLGGTEGGVSRSFVPQIDVSNYGTLNLWINPYQFNLGDKLIVRLGSSDNDYYLFEIPLEYQNTWKEVSLYLQKNSTASIKPVSVQGNPDLTNINKIELAISGQTGKVWINNINLSDQKIINDGAYWVETSFNYNAPLLVRGDKKYFNNLSLKFINNHKGKDFNSLQESNSKIENTRNQFYSSIDILPEWNGEFKFFNEQTLSDSNNKYVSYDELGENIKNTYIINSAYKPVNIEIPAIYIQYKQDTKLNQRNELNDSVSVDMEKKYNSYYPTLVVERGSDKFLGSKIRSRFTLENSFIANEENLTTTGSPEKHIEKNNRQSQQMNFSYSLSNKYFFIQPQTIISSEEFTEYIGKILNGANGLANEIKGSFHFPFYYSDDNRFIERNNKLIFKTGINRDKRIAPEWNLTLQYFNNNFSDYSDDIKSLLNLYKRKRNSTNNIESKIILPVRISKKDDENVKGMTFSYRRNVNFNENEIPYEGEHTSMFEEKYGILNSLPTVMNTVFNIYKYPPWFSFYGNKNYSNSRKYLYAEKNKQLVINDIVVSDYQNYLKILDAYDINSIFDFNKFVVTANYTLNQICERVSIGALPQQVITQSIGSDISCDLMKIFKKGFFRANNKNLPTHGAQLTIGYNFIQNMLITQNIQEFSHQPKSGITLKNDKKSLGLIFSLNLRDKKYHEYINSDDYNPESADLIYYHNISTTKNYREKDTGYSFKILYETDVKWLYSIFNSFYKLSAMPMFYLEYNMLLNYYNYQDTVSIEPFDQHILNSRLLLNLHNNIQGGITGKWGVENYYSREDHVLTKQISSIEVGMQLSIIF